MPLLPPAELPAMHRQMQQGVCQATRAFLFLKFMLNYFSRRTLLLLNQKNYTDVPTECNIVKIK